MRIRLIAFFIISTFFFIDFSNINKLDLFQRYAVKKPLISPIKAADQNNFSRNLDTNSDTKSTKFDLNDLSGLLSNWGRHSDYPKKLDINLDGQIDQNDYRILVMILKNQSNTTQY